MFPTAAGKEGKTVRMRFALSLFPCKTTPQPLILWDVTLWRKRKQNTLKSPLIQAPKQEPFLPTLAQVALNPSPELLPTGIEL